MKRRILTTAVAATLAVAGLAGCRTNVGVAARVDGSRITESQVNDYLAPGGVDKQLASQAAAQGQQVSPRTEIVLWLVREQVFEKTLNHFGVRPTDGELNAEHDTAGSGLLQAQLSGAQIDRTLEKQLLRLGIKKSFRARLLRAQELEYLLIKKRKMTQEAQLLSAVRQADLAVSVGPRYGRWDAKTLSVTGGPVLPSFVSAQPSPNAGS